MIIRIEHYVGPHAESPDWNQRRLDNAIELLSRVNGLKECLEAKGVKFQVNPNTGTHISGKTFGGFRPQSCPQGAPNSSHKTGQGIDLYDPQNEIDEALADYLLKEFDLYREHPSATNTWCHLSTRAPNSKKRTFMP